MVMVGGGIGRINLVLEFPKKNLSVVVGEVNLNVLIVLLFLIVTVRSSEVLSKALLPIVVTKSGMFMETKLVQLWKVLLPIVVTEVPIVTDVKPLQSWKALLPIVVTELGIVTDVKPLQFWKALIPITFTELGIVTDVKPLQSVNT
jgi:hypothetical protein